MRMLFNLFGGFSLAVALLGLGAALFGDAGFWGFLVFLFGAWFGGFWLLLGVGVAKLGRVRTMLFPDTPEATLRRRLLLASIRGPARREADTAIGQLSRLEHVWESIRRHLAERLAPAELTYQRYSEAARQACVRALQELTEATGLIESLGVLKRGRGTSYLQPPGAAQNPLQARREQLVETLAEAEQAVAALERLDLALVADLQTGQAAREVDLDSVVAELDRLAGSARRYVTRP